jgi:hypothetical protein
MNTKYEIDCEKMSELLMELVEKEPIWVMKYFNQEMADIVNYYQCDEYQVSKLKKEYTTASEDRREEIRHDLSIRGM